jgi:acyl-[acyl carrier protein]--UDP-N-acetylglucosamine O-acyltransferase
VETRAQREASLLSIHPSAIIHPDAQLGENVTVGPFTIIHANVRIGANAVIFTDVPDNCVAVVNGVRTIHKSEPLDNRFMPISKLKESE